MAVFPDAHDCDKLAGAHPRDSQAEAPLTLLRRSKLNSRYMAMGIYMVMAWQYG